MRLAPFFTSAALSVGFTACASSTGTTSIGATGGTTGGTTPAGTDTTASASSTGTSATTSSAAGTTTGRYSASGASGSSSTGSSSTSGSVNSSGLWVTGYYTGFDSQNYPVGAVDFAAMTHVVVGPVLPNADGSLDTTFSLGNAGPAWATAASSTAHGAGDKVLLWVGGTGSEPGFVGATSSSNLATLVANLIAAMSTYDADGVDLDWEPLATGDEAAFTSLLQALRTAAPDAILTLPIGALNMNTDSVDPFFANIASLVDQENIMTYGMAGAWEGWESWHSSPIGGESPTTPMSIDSSVKAYLAAGVPAAKLGIGIGFFGLCYTPPVTGPMQALGASTIAAADGTMSYANIMSSYYTAAAAQWDSTALVPYLSFSTGTGPEGCSFISYDDAQSVGSKAAYVKANGLGGTILWELSEGYLPGTGADQGNALMEAVRTSFLQ